MDLDVALNMTNDNLMRALAVFRALGLTPRAPVPAEDLLDAEKVQRMIEDKHAQVFTFMDIRRPDRQVDVFLPAELAYDVLARNAQAVLIAGHTVRVVSRERLIAMKRAVQPPRPKDLHDVAELERLGEP